MTAEVFRFRAGAGPLVVAMPHVGTALPADIAETLTPLARQVRDTDWHIEKLYGFLVETDASVLQAVNSRTVIDLNRSPENIPLYPGRFETGLLPMTTFEGEPLYLPAREPDAAETARRLELYWRPYHAQLRAALDAAKARHGYALLLDAHSIRQRIPALFDGLLPDVNVGAADGQSCAPALVDALREPLQAQTEFSWVIDGRFKGGWTTRHYGRPDQAVHAVQFELVQAAYMNEAELERFDPVAAKPMQGLLTQLIAAIRSFSPLL